MSDHVNTSMVRLNWKGMFVVIPLVWYAVALTVSSPLLHEYILQKNITYVPMNHEEYINLTKGIKCEDPNHILTYVLDPVSNRTHLGCFYEKNVIGRKCPEFNNKSGRIILQPKYSAPCDNLDITPCNFTYKSSESYKLFGCFLVYGGIPSLMQQGQKIENSKKEELILRETIESLKKTVKERDEQITNQYVAIGVVVTCIIIILAILAFSLFHIKYRMDKNRKNIANGPFEKIIAGEERQSNEDDPLNGPFENIRTTDISDIQDVELEVEHIIEDQPPISIN